MAGQGRPGRCRAGLQEGDRCAGSTTQSRSSRQNGFPCQRSAAVSSTLLLSPDADSPTETWPALIAAVTDLDGRITGAHRTWLDGSGRDKAPIDTPRRRMGPLLGNPAR